MRTPSAAALLAKINENTRFSPARNQIKCNYTLQLFHTLVKFRWHESGLTADIEKAFLMVGINEADKHILRFLRFKDPGELYSKTLRLRFTRLVFIQYHLDAQISEKFKAELVEHLNSLYIDDLVIGEATDEKVLDLYSKSKSIMHWGAFNLRKWNTNSMVV